MSSSFQLDFFNKSIDAIASFGGDGYLQNFGNFEASINLTQLSFGIQFSIGTNIPLGPLNLGILQNTAGIYFNVIDQVISFNADVGNLATLSFVGIDGAEFSFSPWGSISLGLKLDFMERRITFTEDTGIELGLLTDNIEKIPDSVFYKLLKKGKIHYGRGDKSDELFLSVGLTIKEGSFIDFDDLILFGTASIDIGWHNVFEVSAVSVTLHLNFQESFISGQILSPGISIAKDLRPGGWFDSIENEVSFEFRWSNLNPSFTFIGEFNSLIPSLLPDLDVRVKSSLYDFSPRLTGSLRACFEWLWLQFCPGVDIVISSEGLEVWGIIIYSGDKNKTDIVTETDSVHMLANPYANTVTGTILNETKIPQTQIKVKPFSNFNFVYNPNAPNAGNLHLHSIIDGTNLTWNYRDNGGQITAALSNFEGFSLSLASNAYLKLQSNTQPNRFIEINIDGTFLTSNFSDGFSYFSPDSTLSNGRIWKIIRIYPEDSTEEFAAKVTPINSSDTLLFTLVKDDQVISDKIFFARYNSHIMNMSTYEMEITPSVMNYSFTNGNDIIGPNSVDNVAVENGLLYLSHISHSFDTSNGNFRIKWETSFPTNSIVHYGPNVEGAIYTQSNNQMLTNHDVIITGSTLQLGWVYQIKCTNSDSESVYSEWRMFSDYPTSIDESIELPQEYSLLQNYPNPFNPSTTISYRVPEVSDVVLKVYDVIGREVSSLVNEEKAAGEYRINFNAGNLASGIYFYRLEAKSKVSNKNFTKVGKMVLTK